MHVMRYVRGTLGQALVLGKGKGANSWLLEGYTDADWGANDESRRSISGYCFIYGNGAISWSSKRQQGPAVSSTEAEYMSLARGTKEALWLQRLLGELTDETCGTIPLHVDNGSCIALAKKPRST